MGANICKSWASSGNTQNVWGTFKYYISGFGMGGSELKC